MSTHERGLPALEPVERKGLRRDEQALAPSSNAPARKLASRRGQCRSRAARRVRRQLDGALEERGRCREAATCPRAVRRALELGSDVLVGPAAAVREVPGTAVGVEGRVRRGCQRGVDRAPLLRGASR